VTITGRFAFVEFRHPDYATAALQLNGQIALMGNTLKIARPASYVEPMGGAVRGVGGARELPGGEHARRYQPRRTRTAPPLPHTLDIHTHTHTTQMPGLPMPAAAPGGFPGPPPGGMPGAPPAMMPGPLPGPPAAPAVAPATDPLATPIPTPFLGVIGMVTPGVLTNPQEYDEVRGWVQGAE
jgi:hypothetical protein